MPIYGIQMPLALILALLLRANLPIFIALQIISNPITAIPLWLADYQVGRAILGVVGMEVAPINREQLRVMLDNFINGEWGDKFENLSVVFSVTSLGAIVMGTFFGLVGSVIYRIIANRTAASYVLLRDKLHLKRSKDSKPPFNPDI
jgi:uncharacterized protein (DUF2062 family)